MIQNTPLQTLRVRIVFFLAAVANGLVQQIARLVQTSLPRHVRIHRVMIVYVFSIIDGGAFDFADSFIDVMDRISLLCAKLSAVGPLQKRSGESQIGKSVQVAGMFSL